LSDQAIIGLIVAVTGGICTLIYYLMSAIRTTLKDAIETMLEKIEKFVQDLSKVKEDVAVKSTMLDYMQREIEGIKKNCWKCNNRD